MSILGKIKEISRRRIAHAGLKQRGSEIVDFLHVPSVVLKKGIGRNVYVGKETVLARNIADCTIGYYTYINGGYIYENVHIGKFCSIAFQTCIGPGEHYTVGRQIVAGENCE